MFAKHKLPRVWDMQNSDCKALKIYSCVMSLYGYTIKYSFCHLWLNGKQWTDVYFISLLNSKYTEIQMLTSE